jgi:hypothetical protein
MADGKIHPNTVSSWLQIVEFEDITVVVSVETELLRLKAGYTKNKTNHTTFSRRVNDPTTSPVETTAFLIYGILHANLCTCAHAHIQSKS